MRGRRIKLPERNHHAWQASGGPRFMEIDGVVAEIQGDTGRIKLMPRNQRNSLDNNNMGDKLNDMEEGENAGKDMIVIDPKRKRVENDDLTGYDTVTGPPKQMSLLAWNCRGLTNSRAIRFLRDIVTQVRPSFIFLSETKVKKAQVEKVCKVVEFSSCFNIDAEGIGVGLALLWKNECDILIRDSCLNYIDFEVNIAQVGRWRYTGYYGYPERDRRHESWTMLRNLAGNSNLPWCIIGDFNDIMFAEEKQENVPHPRSLMQGFTEAINDCRLIDLGSKCNKFTWEKSRGTERWVQERLDRGLCNSL